MTRLWQKKWFRALLIAALILLQFLFLLTLGRGYDHWTQEEVCYASAALMPYRPINPMSSLATPLQYEPDVNVFDNAASWGIPPLYTLLLRHAYSVLQPQHNDFYAVPVLLNLCAAVPLWIVLCLLARRLLPDGKSAWLFPLLIGFSLMAPLGIRMAAPHVLTALFAALTLFSLQRIYDKRRAVFSCLLLFLSVLCGFLTWYPFGVFAACCAAVTALCAMPRHRFSVAVTAPVLTAAGLLAGFLIFPAAIDHLTGERLPFSAGYLQRLKAFYEALSGTVFGGLLLWVAILSALAGLVLLYLHAVRPKDLHAPEEAPKTESPEEEDPAAAAYRRRAARRTKKMPAEGDGRSTVLPFTLLALSLLAYALCAALLHYIPLSLHYDPYYSPIQTAGAEPSLLYCIYPLVLLFFSAFSCRAIRRMGAKPGAAAWITAGIFLALAVISYARSDVFRPDLWVPLFS